MLDDIMVYLLPLLIGLVGYLLCFRSKQSPGEKKKNEETVQNYELPPVTIAANHIVLNDNFELPDENRAALELLAKHATIILLVEVKDQEEADRRTAPLQEIFDGIVNPDYILFCQTAYGRGSMSRQLEAVTHIDYDPEAVIQTASFHPSVLIAPDTVKCEKAKWRSTSLSEFLSKGNTDFYSLFNQ